jgi:transcriptional regulator with XRE-family HTH domain
MAKTDDIVGVRIPSVKKLEQITNVFENDEDYKFNTIKANRDKPRFELIAPTADDPDNIEITTTFDAVILKAEKNFYQSPEDKQAGKPVVEKRVLYVLRNTKFYPEVVYLNPTSLRPWKTLVMSILREGGRYYDVLVRFSLERVKSAATGYNWNKYKFEVLRSLTDEEREHIAKIKPMAEARIRTYETDEDLDKYEEEALNEGRPTAVADPAEAHAKATNKALDDDDESVAPPSAKAKAAPAEEEAPPAKTRAKAKAAPAEDDDEDAPVPPAKTRANKAKAAPAEDDDEDAPVPVKHATASKPGYAALSVDDDDEDVVAAGKPKPSRAVAIEDDDED